LASSFTPAIPKIVVDKILNYAIIQKSTERTQMAEQGYNGVERIYQTKEIVEPKKQYRILGDDDVLQAGDQAYDRSTRGWFKNQSSHFQYQS
jgi:uncharacterized membrane-anchored protein